MPEQGELEWNLAAVDEYRLADVLKEVRRSQMMASRNPTKANVRQYLRDLQSVFLEIIGDIKESKESDIEDALKNARQELDAVIEMQVWNQERDTVLQKVYEADKVITRTRKEAGLGMPKGEKLDPENAAVEGLLN